MLYGFCSIKRAEEGLYVTLVDLTGLKSQLEGLCATLLDLRGFKASRKGSVSHFWI
jgi:hypothetical protein